MNAPRTLFRLGPALVIGAIALGGCQKQIEAPYDKGVCFQAVFLQGGKVKFNEVARNRPSLESCAAALEGMRVRFLQLGGNQTDIIGSYQGNFLFLDRYGVFTSPSLTAARYPALVRTGDGRLAVPGSVTTN